MEYLERYYFLICFAAFLQSGPQPLRLPHRRDENGGKHGAGGDGKENVGMQAGSGTDRQAGKQAMIVAGGNGVSEGVLMWSSGSMGFRPWMKARPELYSILRR